MADANKRDPLACPYGIVLAAAAAGNCSVRLGDARIRLAEGGLLVAMALCFKLAGPLA